MEAGNTWVLHVIEVVQCTLDVKSFVQTSMCIYKQCSLSTGAYPSHTNNHELLPTAT